MPYSIAPMLSVRNGARAVEFYKAAFGAEELMRHPADDGRLMHAHLRLNGASLMLHDHFAEHHGGADLPQPVGVLLHLQVNDADAWWNRAVAAGGTIILDLADQFWGDRYGQLKDPFGHSWSIGAPVAAPQE